MREIMSESSWYIVKQPSAHCEIVPSEEMTTESEKVAAAKEQDSVESWGPFDSKSQAIAKRVGLIRAGKCKPN